ncbi:MAG: DinB family protein [Planctomycetota bacterium]
MSDVLKQIVGDQYEAVFCTLAMCVDACPEVSWDAPVGDLAFCQVVFHTLFFSDLYTGVDIRSQREQAFHREHAEFFRDYEELADRRQTLLYDRTTTESYLQHCREKASSAVRSENAASLQAACGFYSLKLTRAELHIYNIRHVQHHAAQLSLRLRLDTGDGVPWVGSGWRNR